MKPSCDHCNRILQWGELVICAIKDEKIIWAECMPCCDSKPDSEKSKVTEGVTWQHYEFGKELYREKIKV